MPPANPYGSPRSCYAYAVRKSVLTRLSFVAWATVGAVACTKTRAEHSAAPTAEPTDVLAVADALERDIAGGTATTADRERAYEVVQRSRDDGSAGHAYARAALAGRLAEVRGLRATGLVREAEAHARSSLERDPEFREGSARRLLGSLYALAADYVEHGDSELGLELLEEQTQRYGHDVSNHLRLGEALASLGDPEAARSPLCEAKRREQELDARERELLADLLQTERIACPP